MVRDMILRRYNGLQPDDVRSTSMGAGGEDIQLSPAARAAFPFSIECKHRAKFAIYNDYDQAVSNTPEGAMPIVFLRANNRQPLVVLDAQYFMEHIA